MGTFIRLFIIGVIVVVVFKIAAAMLPYVLLGILFLYVINHFKKKEKNNVVVHKE